MAIQSRKNQYLGINAHLNSFLQNVESKWEGFHGNYIVYLTTALNNNLPIQYEAHNERSLQIREHLPMDDYDEGQTRRPKPDVTIVESNPTRPRSQYSSPVSSIGELTAPVVETMDYDPENFLAAVIIREVVEGDLIGRPVVRIELLSPTNKPPGKGYEIYRDKRNAALSSKMPLIEIDFLHQSPPVMINLPSYADHEPNAYPYSITVSDPRPSVQTGLAHHYLFSVDTALPLIDIPLDHGEVLKQFDFGAVYNTVFETMRPYHRYTDYEQLPLHFETYSQNDQERVQRRMAAIRRAVENNLDLDNPIPLNNQDNP